MQRLALVVDCLDPLEQLRVELIASSCAASFGASIERTFSSSGSLLAATTPKKTSETRSSSWPLFSRATMVFSKVGGSGLLAMASTSFDLLGHAGLDGGLVIRIFDLGEVRRAKWQSAG